MTRPVVYLSQSMHPDVVTMLAETFAVRAGPYFGEASPEAIEIAVADATALVVRSMPVDAALLAKAPRLRVVVKSGAGTDVIDLAACSARGILVANAAGANSFAVAQHAVALMLAVQRDMMRLDRMVREGRYRERERVGFLLGDLWQATVGLVGFGSIARHVARMVRDGFGAHVLAYSPSLTHKDAAAAGIERVDGLDALLVRADILSLHLPLTPATQGLIGAAQLARMKPSACLINTARGGIIDEAALLAALDAGRLAGAGLDVFAREPPCQDDPLLHCDRVILSPHVGGGGDAALRATGIATVRALLAALSGGTPEHLVNRVALER